MTTSRQKYAKTATRNTAFRDARHRLESADIPDPQSSLEWLICEALGITRTELWANPNVPVADSEANLLESMLVRRLSREPVQYIVGYAEFMGMRFKVDPRVLIPRPETELLVERVEEIVSGRERPRLLDVGTGSGCIAIAVGGRAVSAEIIACDSSAAALGLAAENAASLGVKVEFLRADALSADFPNHFSARFDAIVSNPPYIPREEFDRTMAEVRDFEPPEALFVDGDPIRFYRAIGRIAPTLLENDGWLLFEINPDFADSISALLHETGFNDVRVRRDLAGRDRIVEGRWTWQT